MSQRPETLAREHALKFLYQCEMEKMFYFSNAHFNSFCSHFELENEVKAHMLTLSSGVFSKLVDLDKYISSASKKWTIARMPIIDRSVLRIATYELLETQTPTKVILNEAINLAKMYGTENSSQFVNGLLDNAARSLRPGK